MGSAKMHKLTAAGFAADSGCEVFLFVIIPSSSRGSNSVSPPTAKQMMTQPLPPFRRQGMQRGSSTSITVITWRNVRDQTSHREL